MEFSGQDNQAFKGTKIGRLYLTTHRMIFNNEKQTDPMISFSFPFITLSDVSFPLRLDILFLFFINFRILMFVVI